MIVILLGLLSSVVADLIKAVNKKLDGTRLQGQAAFVISMIVAILAAVVKQVTAPNFDSHMLFNFKTLAETASQIWAISQLYFVFVSKWLGANVQQNQGTQITQGEPGPIQVVLPKKDLPDSATPSIPE